ncbi:hypothetical protein Q3G72_024527 [Acer saccharum]|nr:hypothetical protein Q3G72_024527 [Acer saccharum]
MERPGKWCEATVFRCFEEEEVEVILGIPISCNPGRDSWTWHYDKKGCFSVKSAYKVALNLKNAEEASSSLGSHPCWKKLWQLNLPNKYNSADVVSGVFPKTPVADRSVCNVDAAVTHGSGKCGIGIIFRDVSGMIVDSAALIFRGVFSVEVAEARVIFEGLSMAVSYGLFPLQVELDSLGVVDLCNEKTFTNGDVVNIIADILEFVSYYSVISIAHVP